MKHKFTVSLDDNDVKRFFSDVTNAALEPDEALKGTAKYGTIRHEPIEATYDIRDKEVIITIWRKPFLTSAHAAEAVLKKLFAGNAPPKRRWTETAYLVVCGLVGLLLIADSDFFPHRLQHLANEAGTAFFIAAIIGIAVERYIRHREQEERSKQLEADRQKHRVELEEIQKDIFRHLFGLTIPQLIVEELYQTLFKIKFMRKQLELVYEFSCAPQEALPVDERTETTSQDELLKVSLTVSYILKNMSKDSDDPKIRHYFENVLTLDHDRYSQFTALTLGPIGHERVVPLNDPKYTERKDKKKIVHYKINDKQEITIVFSQEHIRHKMYIYDLTVPPESAFSVRYTYETLRRRRDAELWVSTVAAEGLSIEAAITDDRLGDLEFHPDASHGQKPDPHYNEQRSDSRVLHWTITRGVLPYQGVILHWKPKDKQKAADCTAD